MSGQPPLARGSENLYVDGRRRLKRSTTPPWKGPGPVPQLDPFEPPQPHPSAPPYVPELSSFAACHVLAFGTRYTHFDYKREAEQRLFAREEIDFRTGNAEDSLRIEERLIDALEEGSWEAAAHLYAATKLVGGEPVSEILRRSARVLMEAARRGDIDVDARRRDAAKHDRKRLGREEFFNRMDLYYWRGSLLIRNEFDDEWVDLTFNHDQVAAVGVATWHSARVRTDDEGVIPKGATEPPPSEWRVRPAEDQKVWIFRPEVLVEARRRLTAGLPGKKRSLDAAMELMAAECGVNWTKASISATRRKLK